MLKTLLTLLQIVYYRALTAYWRRRALLASRAVVKLMADVEKARLQLEDAKRWVKA